MTRKQRISASVRLGRRASAALAVVALLAVVVTLSAAGSPPANDGWAGAITLSGATGSDSGTTIEATTEAGEPLALGAGVTTTRTIWWMWTAPSSADVEFDTEGSGTGTTIAAFTGPSVDALSELDSNADGDGTLESRLFFHADASTTYYIQVGLRAAAADTSVTVNWSPNVVANDDFAAASALGADDGSLVGWNVGADPPPELGEPDPFGDAGSTVWYRWTPSSSGEASLSLDPRFRAGLALYSGGALASLTTLDSAIGNAATDAAIHAPVAGGTTYYVQVATADSSPGNFGLQWQLALPPENDDLAGASPIFGGGVSAGGTTRAATLEAGEPTTVEGRTGVQSAWYAWFPGGSGPATVTVAADEDAPHAALVQVYTSAVDNPAFADLTPVGTHEPGQDDPVDAVHLTADADETYYVQVLGDSTSGQDTSFDFTLTPKFDNDLFADATVVAGTDGSLSGTTVGATFPEAGEPDPSGDADNTVWYEWTAPANGPATFSVGAEFAAAAAVYSGSTLGTLVAEADDADSATLTLPFVAQSGVTYHVQVATYLATPNSFNLSWELAPLPDNDDFADATDLGADDGSLDGSTAGATTEPGEPNGDGALSRTVWYSWTPASDGEATLTLTSGFAAGLVVYSGTDVADLQELGESTGESPNQVRSLRLVGGQTYHVQVSNYLDGASGAFTLDWALLGPPAAPTLDSATAGNGSVALAWTPPGSNGGAAITGYNVYRGTSSGGEALLTTVGNVTSFADSTVTNRTTYFYVVAAVNGAGEGAVSNELSATPVNPGLRDLAGSVFAANGAAAAGIAVRACLGATCLGTTTDGNGGYAFADVAPGVYVVRALPSDPSVLAVQVSADATQQSVRNADLRLTTSGTGANDAGPSTFTVAGCTGGTLHYVATADGRSLGSGDVADGAGGSPVDGVYTIDLSSLGPGHPAVLQLDVTITCAQSTETQTAVLFADPSGTVVDDNAGGAPLAGATVTLLDAAGNPIPTGDPRLSAATSANPETSDARGAWGWDVAPGTYRVTATKDGCGAATSGPLTVTPTSPVTNVVLHLACAVAPSSPPPFPPVTPPAPSPTLPEPVAGVSFNVIPISGTVLVNGVVLPAGQQIPFGAEIDATDGIVSITTIGPDGKPQTAFFYGGDFVLTLDPDGVTTLVMKGGDFGVCGVVTTVAKKAKPKKKPKEKHKTKKRKTQAVATAAKAKAPSKKVVRAVWGTGKGSFRTKGRFSSATVRGTLWYHADRCDGTYTQVNEGVVTVLDIARKRTLIVRAGHSVLVRPR